MRARLVVALAAVVLAVSGSAHAATLSTATELADCAPHRGCYNVEVPVFQAAEGEVNDLEVTHSDGQWVFTDPVGITARGPCSQISPTQAECAGPRARAYLGDADDAAEADVYLQVYGGAGDDALAGIGPYLDGGLGNDHLVGDGLSGDDGHDVLVGTGGPDSLWGGAGDDEIRGGEGDDTIRGDELGLGPGGEGIIGRDVIEGGVGVDTVSYRGHTAPVHVDLREGRGGADGENDLMSGVESVEGGSGPDHLIGDDGPNELSGSDGDDVVEGRGGDDLLFGDLPSEDYQGDRNRLYGNDGNDRLAPSEAGGLTHGGSGDDMLHAFYADDDHLFLGGAGDDTLWASDRVRARCGIGNDVVRPYGVRIYRDCERVATGRFAANPYPRLGRSGSLVFRFTCVESIPCDGTFELSRVGSSRPFASRRYRSDSGVVRLRIAVPTRLRDPSTGEERWLRVAIANRPVFGAGRLDVEWAFDLGPLGYSRASATIAANSSAR